jgi:hypothetical protein
MASVALGDGSAIGACVRVLQATTTPLDVQGSTLEVRHLSLDSFVLFVRSHYSS